MLILLPPSEGKTAPANGAPVDLGALAYVSELTAKRERVLAALVRTSGSKQPGRALKALGLSPGQAGELERNAALLQAPAAPAAEVYTGVLFERLRLAELPAEAHGRVLIASALWGVVRQDDRIPAYRLSISARLPRIAGLAWKPLEATVVGVRGFTPDGKVVSHFVKAIRGDVARALLLAPEPPRTPEDVAEIAAAAGHEVELTEMASGTSVDVVAKG